MAETCQSCGQEINEGAAKVRTDTGPICKACMPAYFASLRSKPKQEREPDPSEDRVAEESPADEAAEDPSPAPPAVAEHVEDPQPEPPAEAPPSPFRTLEDIRQELSQVRQALQFEKPSVWNVVGGIVQCFALAALVFAGASWGGDPKPALLLAILLQLMALTFFFNAR